MRGRARFADPFPPAALLVYLATRARQR